MIEPEKRKTIFHLHQTGMPIREIARRLKVHRKTVRRIIGVQGAMPAAPRKGRIQINEDLLRRLYEDCDGWKQRVLEKLVEEEGIDVKYSTLTRRLRELGFGEELKTRCERVPDVPGAEMQHDTSPYTVMLDEVPTKLQGSLIYLRYCKRRYLLFFPRFDRFRMKCFFHEALLYWGYSAKRCIIDNTNLARLRGTGKDAVIVPEMEAFAKLYGFEFACHEVKHSNRKAGVERSFWTVETNFFPGRKFKDLEDLNLQALDWCVRMDHRPASKSGLIPAKAFEHERAHLIHLPPHLPAPYQIHQRGTDEYGYVRFDGNFYWVPGTRRGEVRVIEYADRLQIYLARECLAEYALAADGVKHQRISPEGLPKPKYKSKHRRRPSMDDERKLRSKADVVGTCGVRQHLLMP